jgi:hypothetical protein
MREGEMGYLNQSNRMNNNIEAENRFNELISFVRSQIGEYDMSITRESLIENDLGVTGEDASDLIMAFGKKYQIDISKFNFKKYFNDEPLIFLPDRKVHSLAIGHLEKAIVAGRLDEEVIGDQEG